MNRLEETYVKFPKECAPDTNPADAAIVLRAFCILYVFRITYSLV